MPKKYTPKKFRYIKWRKHKPGRRKFVKKKEDSEAKG